MNKDQKEFIRGIRIIGLAVIGLYLGFRYILPLLYPFVFAYLIAKLILPVVKWLKKKFRIPYIVGAAATALVFVGVLGTIIYFVGKILLKQFIAFIQDIPVYAQILVSSLNEVCGCCDKMMGFAKGCVQDAVWTNLKHSWDGLQGNIMPVITLQTFSIVGKVIGVGAVLVIIVIAVINLVPDFQEIGQNYKKTVFYRMIHPVTGRLADYGFAYVKTQFAIMLVNTVILVAGFLLMKNQYALLEGLGIAFADAFPVIGSGLFLIPWAILKLINRKVLEAAILVTLYCACELVRQFMEPRLLGNKVGLRPIFTIIAMYIGVELFGVAGFILGPLGCVILKVILEVYLRENPGASS